MQGYLDTVVNNRMELAPKQEEPAKDATKEQQASSQDDKDENKGTASPEGSKQDAEKKPTEVEVPEKFFHKE